MVKDGTTYMGLHCNSFTKIEDGTYGDIVSFKEVANGDKSVHGKIIGFGETLTYKSCRIHHSRLDEENKCPWNQVMKDEYIVDAFKTEIYIEVDGNPQDGEEDVLEITVFKRIVFELMQDLTSVTVENLIGKSVKMDYNIDDAKRFIAVSIVLL